MIGNDKQTGTHFLEGGGEMGALIRAKNWGDTEVGPAENWPQSLKTTLSIILNSKFPMFIWWGPNLTCFYNDAYRPSLGNNGKHPDILGMPAQEAWTEIWDIIYPLISHVLETGEATWSEDQLIPIYRNGKIEDVYWTFSYSRLKDDDGHAAGVLVTCTETTEKVLNQQRLVESKEQLEFTINSADLGTWDVDLQNNSLSCNWRVREWMGFAEEEYLSFEKAAGCLSTKDLERISVAMKAATDMKLGGLFEEVYTIHNVKTSEQTIVKSKGKTVFDETGQPLRIVGTIANVTNEIADQKRIIESERNLRTVIGNAPVAIAIFQGENFTVEMVNERALRVWNRKRQEVMNKPIFESMPELVSQGIKEVIEKVYQTGIPYSANEKLIQIQSATDLEEVYVSFNFEPLFDNDGNVTSIITMGVDVTEDVLVRKKIEKSELQIRSMVEHAPFPMGVYIGEEMRIQLANQSILDVWGKGNDVIGKLYAEVLPELEGQHVYEQLHEVYTLGKPFSAKNQPIDLMVDGKIKHYYFNYNFTPLYDSSGKVYGVMNTAADVTDLNVIKSKIEASEKRFRNTVDKAPVGITILMGPEHIVEVANENYLELVSRTEEQFVGKPLFEALPEVKDAIATLLKNVYETGEPYFGKEFPATINRFGKDEIAYFNFVYQALREESGEISGIIVVATDVTDSVLAKHSLAESEKQFRNLVMQSPIPMAIFRGPEYEIELANTVMYEKIWRKTQEEVVGKKLLDVFPELIEQKYPELLQKVMDTGKMHAEIESVAYVMGSDGMRKFYLDFEYAPLFETNGAVSGIMVTVNDVTEKVEARLKLEEAEHRLRLAAEATELATWELDLKTSSIIYSPRLAEIFGHSKDHTIPYDIFRKQVYPEDTTNIVERAFAKALRTGIYKYEARVLRPDQTTRWIRTQGRVFYNNNNEAVKLVGTILDITDEKLRQQELQESEQKFRLLADCIPEIVWTTDANGNVNYCNQSFLEYTGLSQEELQDFRWVVMIHPDDLDDNLKKWRHSVETGTNYLIEHRFLRHDGEYRWHLSRALPQMDEEGNIQMWVGSSTDIQAQKEFADKLEQQVSERTRELEVKNVELEKMNAELQSFAYVSSHDLQEPLRKIQTFANRILERESASLTATGKDYFLRMQKAAKRMQTLIEDLLSYSRASTSERKFEYVSLNEFVDQVVYELKDDIHSKQAIVEAGDLSMFNVIPFQFRQLIHNLVGNSLKFAKPDTAPHIKIDHDIVKGSDSNHAFLSPLLEYYHLSVADNGIGFDEQYQDRIFEVFQRLHGKDEYKGTGIGLAIVKKIVENHNGFITATGKPNEGATFDIYFPVVNNQS